MYSFYAKTLLKQFVLLYVTSDSLLISQLPYTSRVFGLLLFSYRGIFDDRLDCMSC